MLVALFFGEEIDFAADAFLLVVCLILLRVRVSPFSGISIQYSRLQNRQPLLQEGLHSKVEVTNGVLRVE